MPYFEEGVPSPWLLCLWPELRARHLQELDLPVSYFLCSLFISSPSFPVPTQPLSQGQWYLSLPLESMWSAHRMVISGPSSLPVYGHLIHRNTIPTSPVYMSLSPPAPFLPSPEFLVHPLLIFQSAEFKTVELPSSSLPYSTFWSLPHLTKLKSLWFLLGKIFSGPPKTPPWLSSCRPCREHLKGRRRVWLNALSPMETSIVPHSQLRVHKCSLEWMFSCFGGAPRAKHKRVEGEVEGPDIHGRVVLVTSWWQQELAPKPSGELCSYIWRCLLPLPEHMVYKSLRVGWDKASEGEREGASFSSAICMLFSGFLLYCLTSSTSSVLKSGIRIQILCPL